VPSRVDRRPRSAGAGILLLALLLAALAACGGSDDSDDGTAPTTLPPDMSEVQTFTGLTNRHVDGPVEYAQTPPVGGDHVGAMLQNCGFYREPVTNELAVHSLEHGAVWVTYTPDLAASQLDILRDLAADQSKVLVSPYPGLPAPVVASAWGKQLRLPSAGDRRLREFVSRYRESSEAPEPTSTCSGSVGTPER
jgi:Protein of unknown function (DUF3105)